MVACVEPFVELCPISLPAKMPPPTKKRKFITLEDKAAIIGEVEKGRKKMDIAEEFGIACSSLSTILKNKASILGALENGASARNKTVAAAAFPDVDKAVFAWFCEQRANKVPLSGRILQQKALDFACMLSHDNFKASPGWLSRFKARHDIVAKVISGEAAAVDLSFDADMRKANRSVCLLLDNCSAHHVDVQLGNMKRPTDVDMFMALEMIAAAWIATSPAVITNCFTHAGLVTPQASCADPAEPEEGSPVGALDDGDSAVPPSLTSAWGELCAVANEIPDGLSVHEFVYADEGVVVHEEVTDEAIVSSVCEAGDPDEQRPEQPEKTTSPQDVLNAFDTIRSFFGEHDDDVAMDHFLQCESRGMKLLHGKARQSKLTDFWK
ncbi:hypothetical protein HPB49_020598 [Dermacentor silvarum]|uniref:Uncharacterized protein n=1 Tax=Dermacentor silvarum TaxID=543639 RepID=A0ACB8DRP0_DERSI|nr:hypothetical protein HPB49_020598 [Dermacentor silvarum]